MTQLAHKIAMCPNVTQEQNLKQCVGCHRYWALERANKHYKEHGESIILNDLAKTWNKVKPKRAGKECIRDTNSQPFRDLKEVFANTRRSIKNGEPPGFPKIKRHGVNEGFYLAKGKGRVKGKRLGVPKIGWNKLREELRFEGKINSFRITKDGDKWIVSVQKKLGDDYKCPRTDNKTLGVDLGFDTLAVTSNNEKFENPKAPKKYEKNRRLAKSLSDVSFGEFRRQLEYESKIYDVELIIAPRLYPSSKLCSFCGHNLGKLPLSVREWDCPSCSEHHDRDKNSAKNLAALAALPAACREVTLVDRPPSGKQTRRLDEARSTPVLTLEHTV